MAAGHADEPRAARGFGSAEGIVWNNGTGVELLTAGAKKSALEKFQGATRKCIFSSLIIPMPLSAGSISAAAAACQSHVAQTM